MFLVTRLLKAGYLLAFSLVVLLLVSSKPLQAQHRGVSGGFRSTPGLPVIAVPVFSASTSGFGGNVGGTFVGIPGGVASVNVSGSFKASIMTFKLGSLFPNNGRIIGLPPPPLMPPLNNAGIIFTGFSFSPFFINPFGFATPFGIQPFGLGGFGFGLGGIGGGFAGFGGGLTGFGSGVAGFSFGMNSFGGDGLGGFAGKGFGGFNGRKPL